MQSTSGSAVALAALLARASDEDRLAHAPLGAPVGGVPVEMRLAVAPLAPSLPRRTIGGAVEPSKRAAVAKPAAKVAPDETLVAVQSGAPSWHSNFTTERGCGTKVGSAPREVTPPRERSVRPALLRRARSPTCVVPDEASSSRARKASSRGLEPGFLRRRKSARLGGGVDGLVSAVGSLSVEVFSSSDLPLIEEDYLLRRSLSPLMIRAAMEAAAAADKLVPPPAFLMD